MKCFMYLRVSGKGQLEGDGFDRQRLACESYALACDLEIAEVFEEKGVCGASELEDRPALSELYAALEENGIKHIVIEKLDRLARDLMIQETIIADMQKHGYTLLSTCEPDLCSKDPSRVLVRQIFGAIAQYDRAMTVLKLRGARQRMKAKQGKCEGRKRFGERPGEQEILDRMLDLKRLGRSCLWIAEALNEEGVPTRGITRKGELIRNPWHESSVAKILARDK